MVSLLVADAFSLVPTTRQHPQRRQFIVSSTTTTCNPNNNTPREKRTSATCSLVSNRDDNENSLSSRRLLFQQAAVLGGGLSAVSFFQPIPPARAAANELLVTLLTRVRQIPMFCIVNTEGIPFMVISKSEGIARGYAFTSMEGAIIVLGDAQKAAKEGGYGDVWKDATIVTIPGDIAMKMALQKKSRIGGRATSEKTVTIDSLVDIIPTNENREDALQIDKRAFQDQGKMPLFYVDKGLATPEGSVPMFLQKQMLIDAWKQKYTSRDPDDNFIPPIPKLQAMDLTFLMEAALRGYSDQLPNGGNVVFVPDPAQVEVATKLKQQGLTMYKFDQMIV